MARDRRGPHIDYKPEARLRLPGCLSLPLPDLAGRGSVCSLKPQSEGNHKVFPLVCQVPCHDQLALFSLFGSNIMRRDELFIVFGPGACGSN